MKSITTCSFKSSSLALQYDSGVNSLTVVFDTDNPYFYTRNLHTEYEYSLPSYIPFQVFSYEDLLQKVILTFNSDFFYVDILQFPEGIQNIFRSFQSAKETTFNEDFNISNIDTTYYVVTPIPDYYTYEY